MFASNREQKATMTMAAAIFTPRWNNVLSTRIEHSSAPKSPWSPNLGIECPHLMQRTAVLACSIIALAFGAATVFPQPRNTVQVYHGARLILGDSRAPIEHGTIVVQDGRIAAVGPDAAVRAPAGASRVDLAGKTIMPAMVNAHVHIGYEGYTSWGAANHTPANVLDHLQREAFYGVGATQSVGSSPTDQSLQIQRDSQDSKLQPAARFFFM